MKRTITIRIITAVVVAVFVIGTWVLDGQPDFAALKFYGAAVLLSVIIFNLWDFWLWRVPPVQRIPGVPRSIRGTWKGTISSLWNDPSTGGNPQPKTVYLVVQQTRSRVIVKLLTEESSSTTTLAEVSEANGSFSLTYMYMNKPDMRFERRSHIHHGSAVLEICGRPSARLKGRYWTDRDSKGELDFGERKKCLADDYTEAAGIFRGQA